MRRTSLLLALVLGAVLATAACVDKADEDPLSGTGGGGEGAGACGDGELSGGDMLDCVSDSVALIETPIASGSAVILGGGYLVTNAHVVDPYPVADVLLPDGDLIEDAPVVGIDAFADIAVLGPVDAAVSPAVLTDGASVERGDDVYLVGYPGEVDAAPETAISRGLLSRRRQAGEFDLTYLQTDASIGGGQSGGALVDDRGRIIGISGLAFAEEFALALDGADVQASVDRILAGEGDPYSSFPEGDEAATDHTVTLVDELDDATFLIQPQNDDATLRIEVRPTDAVGIAVYSFFGEPLLINSASASVAEAIDPELDFDDIGIEPAEPIAPGVYEVEVPADEEILFTVTSAVGTPITAQVHTSIPASALPDAARQHLDGSGTTTGVIDALETADAFLIELQEGDTLSLAARSPSGDMAVSVRGPGATLADLELFDDGGGGLYDYDAEGEVEADVAGTYVLYVECFDSVVTGYVLDVEVTSAG